MHPVDVRSTTLQTKMLSLFLGCLGCLSSLSFVGSLLLLSHDFGGPGRQNSFETVAKILFSLFLRLTVSFALLGIAFLGFRSSTVSLIATYIGVISVL